MKEHEARELVNRLRDIAIKYHDYGCLREKIAAEIRPLISSSAPDCYESVVTAHGNQGKKIKYLKNFDGG